MTTEQKKTPAPISFGDNTSLPKLIPPFFGKDKAGKFVRVRPCAPEYADKTFLGVYMGDMPQLEVSIKDRPEHEDKVLHISRGTFMGNPAIYVPALSQIIYGAESWWGVISTPDQLRQISDNDIDNVWYVQALKALDETAHAAKPDREASHDNPES
ncbi:hypothetical protein ABE527_18360 [Brucella sp. TWI432]